MLIHAASVALLSILESEASSCNWRHVYAPGGKSALIATIDSPCDEIELSWSPDRTRALVMIRPPTPSRVRVLEVAVRERASRELPAVPDGWIDAAGYDERGRAVIMGLESLPFDGKNAPIRDREADEVTIRGVRYPLESYHPGPPSLAHAWRLDDDVWTLVETVATTAEACDAPGILLLDSWDAIKAAPAMPERRAVHEVIGPRAGRIESVSVTLGVEDGPFGEETYPIAPLSIGGRALEGFPEGTPVRVRVSDGFVLVEASKHGARLYHATTGSLLFTAESSFSTRFWPN